MSALGDPRPARAEAQAAQAAYRNGVRAATLSIVLGLAALLALSAALPTTQRADRGGLAVAAGLLFVTGVLWFTLVPRRAFEDGRTFIGASVIQGVLVLMLGVTGGVQSVYFPYYVLPVLVVILSGSWRLALALGGLAGAGLVGLALSGPLNDAARDIGVTRLFQVAAVTVFAAATATATGTSRRALAARTEVLTSQRDDAFQMAITDELTGLYNRHFMRDELRRMTAHASRSDRPFAIVSLDVDGLKRVNDTRGHQAGDALLREIADALRAVLRTEDIAVRLGGDEFVVLLPEADRGEAVKVAYRIRQRIAAFTEQAASVSSGIGVWRRGMDPDDALREADQELYRAKGSRAATQTG
ncbi:MAG: two-component system, cell cycle response regulator [Chloroflexota bacterium]|nr:two-component system, cell cycle response regulator [Chloroflexota bacterium]